MMISTLEPIVSIRNSALARLKPGGAYSDLSLSSVVVRHEDRVHDFLLHKQFFTSDDHALQYEHRLKEMGRAGASLKHAIPDLQRQFYTHDAAQARYIRREPELTARLASQFARLLESVEVYPASSVPKDILDIGCGSGIIAGTLGRHFGLSADHVVGMDLRRPVSLPRGITFKRMLPDAVTAALGKRKFDVVILSMVLHHSAHPERLLAQACAALRPGGILLLREHDAPASVRPFLDLVHVLHEQVFPGRCLHLPSARQYRDLASWKALAESLGLRQERLEYETYTQKKANPTNNFTLLLRKEV